MGRTGDLVEVSTDGSQLTGCLAKGAKLRPWHGRQSTQVGTEQDGCVGGRRQAAGGRTSLQEQSVVGRQPNIEARLPSYTISSISSTTITNRVR